MRLYWLLAAVVLAGILSAVHHVALAQHLYWYYQWFDTPMHAFGGIAIGFFVVGILPSLRPKSFLLACTVLFLGWEVFEYVIKISQPTDYALDTVKDLCMDALGALIAYALARKTIWKASA